MTDWEWPNSEIVRVIDGDTIVALVTRDMGFHGTATFQQKLRLNRINAAPIKTELGAEAAKFVLDATAEPCKVTITTLGAYKYGDEWMAEVDVPAVGKIPAVGNLSDALVKAGLAEYWDGKGPRPLGLHHDA